MGEDAPGMKMLLVWGRSWDGDTRDLGVILAWGCSWDALGLGISSVGGCSRDEDGPTTVAGRGRSCSDDALGCSRPQQVPAGTLPGQGRSRSGALPGVDMPRGAGAPRQCSPPKLGMPRGLLAHTQGSAPPRPSPRPPKAAITIGQGGRAGGTPVSPPALGKGAAGRGVALWGVPGGAASPQRASLGSRRVTAPSPCRGAEQTLINNPRGYCAGGHGVRAAAPGLLPACLQAGSG